MRQPAGTTKRQSTKSLGSAKPPATKVARQTLHLSESTVKRLGVHCSLVGRDRSAVADEILSTWLARFGKGRAIFDSPEEGRDLASVDDDDRPDGATPVSDSGSMRGI
jgi:hypothetical protein